MIRTIIPILKKYALCGSYKGYAQVNFDLFYHFAQLPIPIIDVYSNKHRKLIKRKNYS